MKTRTTAPAYLALIPAFLVLPLLAASCRQATPPPAPPKGKPPATTPATTQPAAGAAITDWRPLFDGKTLKGWRIPEWGGDGKVWVADGSLHIGAGATCTGAAYNPDDPNAAIRPLPREEYEIELEGQRVDGTDFWCALTFPVGKDHISLVLGGWGGSIVGLSSLDGMDASENPTSQLVEFESNRWYRVRARVTKKNIRCWLDGNKIIDVSREEHKIGVRLEMEESFPIGIATYQTRAAIRNIRLRELELGEE